MISLIGFCFLCLSVAMSLILITVNIFKSDSLSLNKLNLIVRLSTLFIIISFSSLICAYIFSDFSNYNVFQNSHTEKPLIYKITGVWGNHEGSMLMWLCIISLYGFFFSYNNVNENLKRITITIQNILFLFFSFFVLFVSNPFLINPLNVKEGLGLNPILQDPALAIHPPLLYIGYVGYSLIFSLAIAGLIYKKIDKEWIYCVKFWSLFCWSALTAGIALGSYWAYYELGWGGWWFWDPVENVSLMPWIAGLALVHSLFIYKEEQTLKRWIVFLSILCFSLSIFGTVLVRSGILTSVHTFASDPSRGLFILLIFFLITGFGFIILLIRYPSDSNKTNLMFINKTSALIINNIIMMIACATILLGTIYPIIIEVINNTRISVGGPYFNSTVIPIILPGLLLMSIAPILSWQTNRIKKIKNYAFAFILLSLIVLISSIIFFLNPWAIVGIFIGSWIILASIMSIYLHFKPTFSLAFIKKINVYIAHIGVGVLILGITVSSVFKFEKDYFLSVKEQFEFKDVLITFSEIKLNNKKNFQELRGYFIIEKNNKQIALIDSGKNFYFAKKTLTTEAGIFHDWFRDIYIILGEQKDDIWAIKIYNNPLVSFIWLGVMIMIVSGFIGLIKK